MTRPRAITLDAAGVALSALLSEPEGGTPTATVVALHGLGMSAGYFHGPAHPDVSLLTLGSRLGFSVLAVDRPGYGASTRPLPDGQTVEEQAGTLLAALAAFSAEHDTGAGLFLLGHSFGGKVALTAARDLGSGLLGVDVSGCGHRYAADTGDLRRRAWRRNWGPLRLYPPGTLKGSEDIVAPVPPRELADVPGWPTAFRDVAAGVRVPVRLTFAEHESWWHHDERSVADLRTWFTSAPRVVVDRVPDGAHNLSLGWTARAYHLAALGFFEACLAPARCAGRDESFL
ncbi:alpha/beta hydrolase [Actinomadura meridiana]|uniref:Alpha/beta hydrolase n=1 Tax=Actinomadura meridiana TaxID=559626 RepID=A0ABP8BVW1_9ACTN